MDGSVSVVFTFQNKGSYNNPIIELAEIVLFLPFKIKAATTRKSVNALYVKGKPLFLLKKTEIFSMVLS